jgi:hypothetical protein
VVGSFQIVPVEAILALRQATTADAHQPGATEVAERLDGEVVAEQVDVRLVGEEAVVAHLAGEETAGVQHTVVAMEAGQPMAEQPRMVALLRTEARHLMVEVQHMAATTATAQHMEASTRAVVHQDGEALDLATQRPSQTSQHLHPELIMRRHQVHMLRRHPVATAHTLHLHLADPWMLPPQATILRLHPETVMVLHQRLHLHQARGIFRRQRRAGRTPATIEWDGDCTTRTRGSCTRLCGKSMGGFKNSAFAQIA